VAKTFAAYNISLSGILATPAIIIPNGQTNLVKPFPFNADY